MNVRSFIDTYPSCTETPLMILSTCFFNLRYLMVFPLYSCMTSVSSKSWYFNMNSPIYDSSWFLIFKSMSRICEVSDERNSKSSRDELVSDSGLGTVRWSFLPAY